MLKDIKGYVNDGRLVCRCLRSLKPSMDIRESDKFKVFQLDQGSYTLLFARGLTKPGGA